MGLCASTGKESEAQHKTQIVETPTPKVEPKPASAASTETTAVDPDAEFRLVLRDASNLVLDNLAQTLDYEIGGFSEVARKRGLKFYFEIMAPQHFEAVFKEYLDLGAVPVSSLAPSDPSFAADSYRNFLKACRVSSFKGSPSRAVLAGAFQKACTATQACLKASADAADASDLKLHLFFFINALNIMQGDIVGNPGLLFKNVDAFTSGGRVGDAPLPQ